MPKNYAQSYAQRALFSPIYAVERLANPLIPRDAADKQRFCRPLPWATWVPRQTTEYNKVLEQVRTLDRNFERIAGCALRSHFFSSGDDTRASRKNRAASSGGVGLM
jgi:hypothetical protein